MHTVNITKSWANKITLKYSSGEKFPDTTKILHLKFGEWKSLLLFVYREEQK